MASDSAQAKWNRTAVPTVAVMFIAVAVMPALLFGNPRMGFVVVGGWFLIACAVQFWGSVADRVVAIAALGVMIAAVFLPLVLGGSTETDVGVVTDSDAGVTRQS